jgi:hypothetical protein
MSDVIADSHYDISFVADVPPLGLTTYFLHAVLPAQNTWVLFIAIEINSYTTHTCEGGWTAGLATF